MEQEKKLNEEVTEATEATEEVVETVEEVEEVEEVRPEVYDDFSEDFSEPVKTQAKAKRKKKCGIKEIVLSSVISSAISVIVTLAVLFFVNAIPKWNYEKKIEGVWSCYDMYYAVIDDGELSLNLLDPQSYSPIYAFFDFKVLEEDRIQLIPKDEESKQFITEMIGVSKQDLVYEDGKIILLGIPFEKVTDKEMAKQLKDSFKAYKDYENSVPEINTENSVVLPGETEGEVAPEME